MLIPQSNQRPLKAETIDDVSVEAFLQKDVRFLGCYPVDRVS
jgi:hypothetical protein